MRTLVNKIFSKYLEHRMEANRRFMASPHETQHRVLMDLVQAHADTEWGQMHNFSSISSPADYARQVPVQTYLSLKPFIERMMRGETDVLYAGFVEWFAKSSGTTGAVSKYLPVTEESLFDNHVKGSWDTLAFLYDNNPDCNVFAHKSIVMGGTYYPDEGYPAVTICDISALLLRQMPLVGRLFYVPGPEVATLRNWEEKIGIMADMLQEEDISMIGGVPTWTNIFLRKVLEVSGKECIFDVWPNLETYIHGGVNFEPHRKQFDHYFSSRKFCYQEIYNASEGYFSIQNDLQDSSMLLMLDSGIYYEFLPKSEWGTENPRAIPLQAVELGQDYALVITTNAGLWRYTLGDTVQFTSLNPFKIKVSGRTSLYVNAFGEDVIISNTDRAITLTCQELDAIMSDYTMAPVYFERERKGGHEWIVEFEKHPACLDAFAERLDLNLQRVNSNYEQKRFNSMALDRLRLHAVPKGTFTDWLRSKGKYGGQHKVPRLSNNRKYVEEILEFTGIYA
jgi:GH3 auxin-responsive promoter